MRAKKISTEELEAMAEFHRAAREVADDLEKERDSLRHNSDPEPLHPTEK